MLISKQEFKPLTPPLLEEAPPFDKAPVITFNAWRKVGSAIQQFTVTCESFTLLGCNIWLQGNLLSKLTLMRLHAKINPRYMGQSIDDDVFIYQKGRWIIACIIRKRLIITYLVKQYTFMVSLSYLLSHIIVETDRNLYTQTKWQVDQAIVFQDPNI